MTGPTITTVPRARTTPADATRTRRQISHDINHELATIRLLTALLIGAPDVGADSRRHAALILGETRWLEQLHRAYEDAADPAAPPAAEIRPPIRMDEVVAEVVDAMHQASLTRIVLSCSPVSGRVNRLALWRVVRNIIDNAIRAAGPDGTVDVRVVEDDGWVVIQVDDDGPGFATDGSRRSRLGLSIVQDFLPSVGGHFDIRRGHLGGCRIRMHIPLAAPPHIESSDRAVRP